MENPKKPSSALHRRLEPLDVKRSSSSLNMSTSSLKSVGQERKGGAAVVREGRRSTATVRFAPPPPTPQPLSSSTSTAAPAARSSRSVSQQQAVARPATARPASSSGRKGGRPATSSAGAGRLLGAGGSSEPGAKAMRRSWGWAAACVDAREGEIGEPTAPARTEAKAQVRSSSAPRRLPTEEKPMEKRESKLKTSRRNASSEDPPPKLAVQRSPNIARKAREKVPSNVALKNGFQVVPSPSRTTPTMIGASWDLLPSDLRSLGLDVMSYRDAAEAAAVEALREASAAEVLLRCLSAFASLTAAAGDAEQPPQHTVDEFLALHGALTRSAAVLGDHYQARRHAAAEEWLGAAVATDLAGFQLYTAAATTPPASATAGEGVAAEEEAASSSWLEAAAREAGEAACAWFLGYVERLVDGDVAGTLGQLKRVNDWLDGGAGRWSEGAEVERLRKKIFGYLLDHVESAVVALNGGVGPGKRK